MTEILLEAIAAASEEQEQASTSYPKQRVSKRLSFSIFRVVFRTATVLERKTKLPVNSESVTLTKSLVINQSYITCEKFRTISDKQTVRKSNRPKFLSVRNFNRPKILRYSKTTLVSRNKSDVIRKGLEMAGIVEAVTKELEQEVPFKILVVD